MATKTINKFGAVADILSSDFNFAAQPNAGGNNVKITKQQIKDYALSGLTTTAVAEGDNLYYTQARFDAALSAKKDVANGVVAYDADKDIFAGKFLELKNVNGTGTVQLNVNDQYHGIKGVWGEGVRIYSWDGGSPGGPKDFWYFNETTGNFGIGVNPTQKLHVDGNALITGTLNAGNSTLGTLSCGAITSSENITSSKKIFGNNKIIAGASTEDEQPWNAPYKLRVVGAGSYFNLHNTNTSGFAVLEYTTPNYNDGFSPRNRNNAAWQFGLASTTDGSEEDRFFVGRSGISSEDFCVNRSGNVGIDIVNPTEKLHVNGNVLITGTLNAGNSTLGTLSAGNSTLGTLGCGAITSTGNLSCSTLLTIESPAATNGTVQFKLLDEYHGLKAVPGTGLRMFSWKDNVATDFWFFNENTGNFGVGINPTEKLHVNGNGLITGTLDAGDSTLGEIACDAITSTGSLTFAPDTADRAEGAIGNGRLFFRVDQPNAKFYVKGKTAAGVVYNYDLTSGGSGSGDVTGGSASIAGAIATYSSDTGKAIDYRDTVRVYSSSGARFTEFYTDNTYGQLNSYVVADPNPTPADLRIQSHGGKTTFGQVAIDGHGWLDAFDTDGSAIEGSDFALQCYKNSAADYGALALNPDGGAVTIGAFGYLFEGVYTDFWHLASNSASYNGFIGYFGTAGSSITHYYNDNWNKIENNRNTAMIQVGPVFSTLATADSFYGIGRAGVSESMDFRFYGSGKAEFRTLNSGSGTNLVISGTGELLEDTSSKRYKKDIRDYKNHEFIYDMEIKHYKRADCGMEQVGVIAEDFAELQKKHGDLSNYIIKKEVKKIREKGWEAGRSLKDGDFVIDGVAKQDFIFPVILALQEQRKEIEQLKQQLKKGK